VTTPDVEIDEISRRFGTFMAFDSLTLVAKAGEVFGLRRAVGYVPEALSVDGSLTGYENLLIFAKLYDISRGGRQVRIRKQLTFVDLTAD
jgi:ABC-type multidrug transport system ATPase subunit